MSSAEIQTEEPRSPLSREADLLVRATRLVLADRSTIDIARELHVTYARAVRLRRQACRDLLSEVPDRPGYTAEVLEELKGDLTEILLDVVRNSGLAVEKSIREGNPVTRPYTHLNSAIKQISLMQGLNAPTASVSLNLTDGSMVHPDNQQAAIIDADATIQELWLAINARRRELAFAGGGDGPGGLRGHGEPARVGALPAPGVHQPDPGPGGVGEVAAGDDLRAPEARQE